MARLDEQAAVVLEREADVVCLQEVTSTTVPRWREALAPMAVQCLLPATRRLAGDGEVSWTWRRWTGGYRLDHRLVSGDVAVERCEYHHAWREAGLGDHSAMEADLRP